MNKKKGIDMNKKFRFLSFIATLVAIMFILVGCGSKQTASRSKYSIALVTDGGPVDDKSFNQSAWEGMQAWGKSNGLSKGVNGYNYAQSSSDADFSPNINKLIRAKYSTIFGIGYKLNNAITTAAKENPKVKFAVIDSVVKKQKNVVSVLFKTEQSSFLAGVAAAKTTKTNKVGFVGGIDGVVIKTFEKGFVQGVKAVNPKIQVDIKYAGSFTKADVGQSLANAMYNNGADVIFHASGATGAGVFTAAKNISRNGKKVWVIGVDQDQKADGKYAKGNVTLASAVKEVGNAVQDIAEKTKKGKFPGNKTISYDLKSKGVSLANDNLSPEAQKAVKEFQEKIESGEVVVKPN